MYQVSCSQNKISTRSTSTRTTVLAFFGMGYCIGCNCLIFVVAMFALVEVCFLFIDNQCTQKNFLVLGIKYTMKTHFF
jgi:hypothetical protein